MIVSLSENMILPISKILTVALLCCIYLNSYVVSGTAVWNVSCVRHDNSCSECCVNRTCHTTIDFPNVCKNGCIDGHRGARCYELCSFKCKNCAENIDICNSCFDGFYLGENKDCKSKCLPNCKVCLNGYSCSSCKEGFYNKDGTSDCRYRVCPQNCECRNSECIACKEGFYDINTSCNSKCPNNCKNCSSYSQCNVCKDGFFNENRELGICTNICRKNCTVCSSFDECSKCQPVMFGKLCNNICSAGCRRNDCEIETGKCDCLDNFTGDRCTEYVSGWYGNSCDRTCPYHCNKAICGKALGDCTEGCRSDTMTGLFCENCVSGRYGLNNCEKICPKNCLNKVCDKENGTCTQGCKDGFGGAFCVDCVRGKYGYECKENCPEKCKSNNCKKMSGHCFECVGNFDGNMCDTCKPGLYGSACHQICSSNCANDSCDVDTGKCSHGCREYYFGDKCCVNSRNCLLCANSTTCRECSPGHFGDTCNQACSDLCINNICEKATGVCAQGCTLSLDSKICSRSQGNRQEDKNDSKDTTLAVLATLFAVSFLGLITMLLMKLNRNCTPWKGITFRKHEESLVLNDIESSTAVNQNKTREGETDDDQNVPYDNLNVTQHGIEYHMYESGDVHEIDNLQTYVNV